MSVVGEGDKQEEKLSTGVPNQLIFLINSKNSGTIKKHLILIRILA